MAKRKRQIFNTEQLQQKPPKRRQSPIDPQPGVSQISHKPKPQVSSSVQIITGSYDRVLHGIIATLPAKIDHTSKPDDVIFNDNFLFDAHGSAIRCLALSPQSTSQKSDESRKLILASGGTDERINLYHVSTSLPPDISRKNPRAVSLSGKSMLENPQNKALGTLMHHSANVNALYFATKTKLLSGSEDNTIAISRTRDWTVLSTIKAPIPRAVGRPSGDTAPPGGTPTGINDFAVHPSMKLMISVGKGEKCMRLWNLVTGKKAGVLNFERALLQAAGEGKFSSGEGRRVIWNVSGDGFAVGFDRGAIVFSMDSKPVGRTRAIPTSKIHQLRFLSLNVAKQELLVVSTEDGRMIFYSLESKDFTASTDEANEIPSFAIVGELGGKAAGVQGRIKDFEILTLNDTDEYASFCVVTAGSDGVIRLWQLSETELTSLSQKKQDSEASQSTATNGVSTNGVSAPERKSVGKLLGTYTTTSRITCLKAFMLSEPESETINDNEVPESGSGNEFEGFD